MWKIIVSWNTQKEVEILCWCCLWCSSQIRVCGDYWNARLTKLKIASDNRIKRGIVVQIELQTIWDDVQSCVEMQYGLHQYQWPLVNRFASGITTLTCAVIFERRSNTRLCCNGGKLIGQFGVNRVFVAGNNSLHYRSGPLKQTRRRLKCCCRSAETSNE